MEKRCEDCRYSDDSDIRNNLSTRLKCANKEILTIDKSAKPISVLLARLVYCNTKQDTPYWRPKLTLVKVENNEQ